jgi:beta-galactosidase/beta-glucuronidase
VNGTPVARHDESYLPFSADITDALTAGENCLTVRAVNDVSCKHLWGKQKIDRGGMWYTPCSGIWQTVWLEPVPDRHISSLKIRTEENRVEIRLEGAEGGSILFGGEVIPFAGSTVRFPVKSPRFWSPEDPYLYRFSLRSGEDAVESYFALRTLSIREVKGIPRLCLNGEPYFFHALLDQGYWSDGLYTPADPEGFERDILAMKALGFNTLRKHIKIEPEQFYYDCDRLGMVVFQDMVNCGKYIYFRDTVIGTILGIFGRGDHKLNRDREARTSFLSSMDETVRLLGNHPCICLWTIFNEGWGQFCADSAYRRLKTLDPSRFIDSTSGWFRQRESDVESLHIYFRKLYLTKRKRRPQLISEFGGWSLKIPDHSFNPEKTFGYRKYTDREAFLRDLKDLYAKQVLPLVPKGLCGAVYTEVSDVEDETNGLLTYDRREAKVKPEDLEEFAVLLQEAVRA